MCLVACVGFGCGDDGTGLPDGVPALLSATGLFKEGKTDIVDGAIEYRPFAELWADGATKRRWLLLPDDELIDTSDLDLSLIHI